MGPCLALEGLTVDYGRQRALDDVSVTFERGEVHGLLGPNGSGKSTLVKVLSGVVTPRRARIEVGGAHVSSLTPERAARAGLRFVHQDLALLPELSVLENVFLANRYPVGPLGIRRASSRRVLREVLDRVGLDVAETMPVAALSTSARVLVATARALLGLPDDGGFVFVDEPTAALDEPEAEALLGQLRTLAEGGDVGICLITHRLREVERFADRVTVLRDGRVTLVARREELDEAVLLSALGASVDATPAAVPAVPPDDAAGDARPPRLELRGVTGARLRTVDLSVAAGEIVGVSGLEGSGKDELVEVVFGSRRVRSGTLLVDGVPRRIGSERDALALGIGLVPGERQRLGGIGVLSVADNLLLGRWSSLSTAGCFRPRAAAREARRLVEAYGVVPAEPGREFATLSGGNQQKVVVGRWLSAGRRVLVLHEPTAGVDVGSRAMLHRLIREAAGEGMAILVVSSDLVEVETLCDRAVVLADGQVVAHLRGADLTVDQMIQASFAASAATAVEAG